MKTTMLVVGLFWSIIGFGYAQDLNKLLPVPPLDLQTELTSTIVAGTWEQISIGSTFSSPSTPPTKHFITLDENTLQQDDQWYYLSGTKNKNEVIEANVSIQPSSHLGIDFADQYLTDWACVASKIGEQYYLSCIEARDDPVSMFLYKKSP